MSSAEPIHTHTLTRRDLLAAGVSGAIALGLLAAWPDIAEAAPKDAKRKIAEIAGDAALDKDGITLTMPARTDRAAFVPVTVRVDSPMTEEHHVTAIHLLAERNTKPDVATYHLTPMNGRAEISTRIRIAKSGVIIALAQLSDGTVRIAKARVKVAAGAGGCG